MGRKRKDLSGKIFGNIKVISLCGSYEHHSLWNCECICGKIFTKYYSNIIRGKNLGCDNCYRSIAQIKLRPFESRYNSLVKLNENRCNVEITYEDFVEFTKIKECHYCEAVLNWKPYLCTGYYLDRKNNDIGYTKENCVVCCPRCNESKSDHFTYDEWKKIGNLIKSWSVNGS